MAVFDAVHVRSVDSGEVGELLLRDAFLVTQFPNCLTDNFLDILQRLSVCSRHA